MKQIILASSNLHKTIEISQILNTKIVLASDFLDDFNPVENGATFSQNATIKANALKDALKKNGVNTDNFIILADDSGLCVDALNGEPGIFSARYAKNNHDLYEKYLNDKNLGCILEQNDDEKNQIILKEKLKNLGLTQSNAYFMCAICVLDVSDCYIFEGRLDGVVRTVSRGNNGFGYDSMFFVENKSLAELSSEKKNEISHRNQALLQLKNYLKIK